MTLVVGFEIIRFDVRIDNVVKLDIKWGQEAYLNG
jgi:hypothetical protein